MMVVQVNYRKVLQDSSRECGMATGCVKIVKKADEFDTLYLFIRGGRMSIFLEVNSVDIDVSLVSA